eukprot:CAMPEP_0173430794 /NCGR_PEP_ID=MMETSP1357-20121228/9127_1 /TAXON_ID=77926 /ORGANISM="Hemiselmis rufescens, Strain PCC563" /LENGTH=178 /DNA_ID=CAMNT_0014395191 /DNA_START=62 /DNA_END=594 /DNA_ORIENTATION=-
MSWASAPHRRAQQQPAWTADLGSYPTPQQQPGYPTLQAWSSIAHASPSARAKPVMDTLGLDDADIGAFAMTPGSYGAAALRLPTPLNDEHAATIQGGGGGYAPPPRPSEGATPHHRSAPHPRGAALRSASSPAPPFSPLRDQTLSQQGFDASILLPLSAAPFAPAVPQERSRSAVPAL